MGSATSKSKKHQPGETSLSNHLSTDIKEQKADDTTNIIEERSLLDDSIDNDIPVKSCSSNPELYNISSKVRQFLMWDRNLLIFNDMAVSKRQGPTVLEISLVVFVE